MYQPNTDPKPRRELKHDSPKRDDPKSDKDPPPVELYDPIPRQWGSNIARLDQSRFGPLEPWTAMRSIWGNTLQRLFPDSALIFWWGYPRLTHPRACGLKNKDTRVMFYCYASYANPVLIVQINHEVHFVHENRREKADREMRALYRRTDLMNGCKIPLLWGLSTFGTRIRFYCADAKKRRVLTNTPQPGRWTDENGGWTVDLFSEEGCIKMHEIANYIMQADADYQRGEKF